MPWPFSDVPEHAATKPEKVTAKILVFPSRCFTGSGLARGRRLSVFGASIDFAEFLAQPSTPKAYQAIVRRARPALVALGQEEQDPRAAESKVKC